MTKIPIADYLDKLDEQSGKLAGFAKKWRKLVDDGRAVDIEAKLNALKTAMWNLNFTVDLFDECDNGTEAVAAKIKKAQEKAAKVQEKKRRGG